VTADFETWYRAEYPRLVNTISFVVGDRAVAVEAASEACTRAFAKWDRVQAMDHPGGWIYKVALNDARRRLKRTAKERRVLDAQASLVPVITLPVEHDHELWEAVNRLPNRMREVFVLRYVADLTEPAIARTLGIGRGAIATMLRRGHRRLANELQRPNLNHSGEQTHAFH